MYNLLTLWDMLVLQYLQRFTALFHRPVVLGGIVSIGFQFSWVLFGWEWWDACCFTPYAFSGVMKFLFSLPCCLPDCVHVCFSDAVCGLLELGIVGNAPGPSRGSRPRQPEVA